MATEGDNSGGKDPGPLFFSPVLLGCDLLKEREVCFHVVVWTKLVKQFLGLLLEIRKVREGASVA